MQFKIDENLPPDIASVLRADGFDASTVIEQGLSGASDQEVIARCASENRVFITCDRDFSNTRRYPPSKYAGIVVLRVRLHSKFGFLAVLRRILPFLNERELSGRLWIVSEDSVRIRC